MFFRDMQCSGRLYITGLSGFFLKNENIGANYTISSLPAQGGRRFF